MKAEIDVSPNLWPMNSYTPADPMLPSSLIVDAFWQMLGFFLGWLGGGGRPRPISVGEVRILGFALPSARLVELVLDLRLVKRSRVTVGAADGLAIIDGSVRGRPECLIEARRSPRKRLQRS
jgi:3-hydroxyacyl-[acyl-carrier protein] dehydratase/trans-2-decenoyl-[acyl-carrier protein] isomerase